MLGKHPSSLYAAHRTGLGTANSSGAEVRGFVTVWGRTTRPHTDDSRLVQLPLEQHDGPGNEVAVLQRQADGLPALLSELVQLLRSEHVVVLLDVLRLLERHDEVFESSR